MLGLGGQFYSNVVADLPRTILILPKQFLGRRHHLVWFEAKLSLQFFERCRRAKSFHADHAPRPTDVALPAESRGLLHRDARRHLRRQHCILILLWLMLEDVPGWHRHHARPDALGNKLLVGFYSDTHLTARCDENHFRVAV